MNTKSKLIAILAIAMLILVAIVPAVNATAVTIDLNDDTRTRTFDVYKLFDVSVDGENVTYTFNADTKDAVRAYFISKIDTLDDSSSDDAVLEQAIEYIFTQGGDNSEGVLAFANDFAENASGAKLSEQLSGTETIDTTLEPGYYLFIDKSEEADPLSAAMLVTVSGESQTIVMKAEVPDIEKTADETTANVGESVEYTITGKVPNTIGYEEYVYKLTDTFTGLKFAEGYDTTSPITVKIGGTEIDEDDYTATLTESSFVLEFDFLSDALSSYEAGEEIEVTYSAIVTKDAITTGQAINKAELEYSNKPGEDSTNKTPSQEVPVYVFSLDFNKVNALGNELEASFVLKNSEGFIKVDETTGDISFVSSQDDATVLNSDNGYKIAGLKAGEYTLIETETPEGYATPSDTELTFTIGMEEGTEVTFVLTTDSELIRSTDEDATDTVLEADIVNLREGELPSTGSVGTVIFTVVGLSLMAITAIILFVRNRKVND